MATNIYFNPGVKSEQLLYEDIIIESLKMYGQDVYYLPRELVNEDKIFSDDSISKFSRNYKIEMYIENTQGFDGEGDLFTKFGVEIRDAATFIVSRKRWNQLAGQRNNDISFYRPREGDLIYLPLTESIFQVMRVDHDPPFYQLNDLPIWKLKCELFEYNDEDFNTGIKEIDDIEEFSAYQYKLAVDSAGSFLVGEYVSQALDSDEGLYMKGNLVKIDHANDILYIAHAGGTDGKFHEFLDSAEVTGLTSGATSTITAITSDNKISNSEQNEDFDSFGGGFLDFTETNPFGEPEIN